MPQCYPRAISERIASAWHLLAQRRPTFLVTIPDLCADIKAWVSSGCRRLSASTVSVSKTLKAALIETNVSKPQARSRAKNEIHAVLMRCLLGRQPFSDLFGVKTRRWLSGLRLPLEERETVDPAMRQIEFLDSEIAEVDWLIAVDALESPEIKRLVGVPGVNVIVAASFTAAIGDIDRFESPRKLVGYLGLDPRVYQSGSGPASHGRISKQGSVQARHALVEACWSAVRQPGPLHAFYERIRARRGHNVAAARKLCCLFWCLLIREQDYAYSQPSLTKKKLRRLQITADAERYTPEAAGVWKANEACVRPSASSPARPRSLVRAPCTTGYTVQASKAGASATPGRASNQPSKGKAARQTASP